MHCMIGADSLHGWHIFAGLTRASQNGQNDSIDGWPIGSILKRRQRGVGNVLVAADFAAPFSIRQLPCGLLRNTVAAVDRDLLDAILRACIPQPRRLITKRGKEFDKGSQRAFIGGIRVPAIACQFRRGCGPPAILNIVNRP